jgi:hypothetical protein
METRSVGEQINVRDTEPALRVSAEIVMNKLLSMTQIIN